MSTKIKGTTPPVDTNLSSLNEPALRGGKSESKPQNPDSFSKTSNTVTYKSPPLIPGAKMFASEVNLPSHLTDPLNPKNDRKFRRLLGAVLGFGGLEDCFGDLEEELHADESTFAKVSREDQESSHSQQDQQDQDDPEENPKN